MIQTQEFDQSILQESEEFQTFMNYHTGWQFKSIFARIENGQRISNEEFQGLKDVFLDGREELTFSKKEVQQLIRWFNFDDVAEFTEYFNEYNNAYVQLRLKFPSLSEHNDAFIAAQKIFASNLKLEDVIDVSENLRSSFECIVDRINIPQCDWNDEYMQVGTAGGGLTGCLAVDEENSNQSNFENCPNYIENNCRDVYDTCVRGRQNTFIQNIIGCLGDGSFIISELREVGPEITHEQECFYSITGELQCPTGGPSPFGIVGFQGVIRILAGPYPNDEIFIPNPDTGQLFTDFCIEFNTCEYFAIICEGCENNTVSVCCN